MPLIRLLNQEGEVEVLEDIARPCHPAAEERTQLLATALEAVTRLCQQRRQGLCLLDCPGQVLCDRRDVHFINGDYHVLNPESLYPGRY